MGYILALDLSLNCTGYTVADEDDLIVEVGHITTHSSNSIDKRLKVIWKFFEKIKEKYSPEKVIIERGFTLYNTATQQLFRVHGIINLLFEGTEQIYIAPNAVKKGVTGSGRSKKDDVREIIQKIYPYLNIKNTDESDSLAIFYYYKKYIKEENKNDGRTN